MSHLFYILLICHLVLYKIVKSVMIVRRMLMTHRVNGDFS